MIGNKGAKPGEVCALCGEPMNAGFRLCGGCGAVRETQPTFLCVVAAIALAYFTWQATVDVATGTRAMVVGGLFIVVMLFGPEKAMYKKRLR